jgi:hypothetical protein
MKITNLAICFYGQYRTGDICVPHLKDVLTQIKNVNVDIFCSVKDTVSYHTADGSISEIDINSVYSVDASEIEKTVNTLKKLLSPKRINVLVDDIERMNSDVRKDFYVFTGIIDSILLKQQYEAENEMFYDAVILMRYDIMIRPIDYIQKFIYQMQKEDDLKIWPNDPDSIIAGIINDAFLMNVTHPYSILPNPIADLFIAFTGSGADRLCYELVNLVDTVVGVYTNENHKYSKYKHMYDCHSMLTHLANRISLHHIDAPHITKYPKNKNEASGDIHNFDERANCNLKTQPMFALVRPHPDINNMNPSNEDDFDKIMSIWITTQDK